MFVGLEFDCGTKLTDEPPVKLKLRLPAGCAPKLNLILLSFGANMFELIGEAETVAGAGFVDGVAKLSPNSAGALGANILFVALFDCAPNEKPTFCEL